MNRLQARKSAVAFGAVLVFGLGAPVWACMCAYVDAPVAEQVKGALDGASAVFAGKVIGFEYRKGMLYALGGVDPAQADGSEERETKLIRFRVDQWWKMELPSEILIITESSRQVKRSDEVSRTGNVVSLLAGDNFSMCGTSFMKDQSYLVYATGRADRMQYMMCSRTALLDKAGDDLNVLGRGRKAVAGRSQ